MSIKFIVDSLKEKDRKQLELIKKIIDEKPSKVEKNTLFLRRFILAILKQYDKKSKPYWANKEEADVNKNLMHNPPNAPEKINFDFKIPEAPEPIRLKIDLEAPKKIEI